jgi:hypothetical protein
MDQLGNLPPAALIPFGAVLAVIFAVRFLGLWQGEHRPLANSQSATTVAAVIVDPTALNRLSDEAAKLSAALDRLTEIGERKARSEEHMSIELDRLREEMRIQREVGRHR